MSAASSTATSVRLDPMDSSHALTWSVTLRKDGPNAMRTPSSFLREELVAHSASHSIQSLVLGLLESSTTYLVEVKAISASGISSLPTSLRHRTDEKVEHFGLLPYDVRAELHCGLSVGDEMYPHGPPPSGVSFFQNATTREDCEKLCDASGGRCLAFQVKSGEACWLYSKRPHPTRLEVDHFDRGWWCGILREREQL